MKKLAFLTIVLLFSTSDIIAQKIHVKELYYSVSVNEKGYVDRKKVIEERHLTYDKKRGLIKIENHRGSSLVHANESQADLYNNLSKIDCEKEVCKYDDKNRVIEYTVRKSGGISEKHTFKYNDWGDLIEDKCIVSGTLEKKNSESTLSYEYVYLDDFTYAKKHGINYISGMKPDYESSWVLRITRKDGSIVQYTERKISK